MEKRHADEMLSKKSKHESIIMGNTAFDVYADIVECIGKGIPAIPVEIGKLRSIRILHLEWNRIRSIPVELWGLRTLVELALDNNDIDWIPEELGRLEKLETLELSFNTITLLPAGLGNLKELKLLNLQYVLLIQ